MRTITSLTVPTGEIKISCLKGEMEDGVEPLTDAEVREAKLVALELNVWCSWMHSKRWPMCKGIRCSTATLW